MNVTMATFYLKVKNNYYEPDVAKSI
jgi:hypothetical protein